MWNVVEAKNDWSVTKERVYVKDGTGQVRVYDGVAHSPRGKNIGIEVKEGTATKKKAQRTFDTRINNKIDTAVGIGKGVSIHMKFS